MAPPRGVIQSLQSRRTIRGSELVSSLNTDVLKVVIRHAVIDWGKATHQIWSILVVPVVVRIIVVYWILSLVWISVILLLLIVVALASGWVIRIIILHLWGGIGGF